MFDLTDWLYPHEDGLLILFGFLLPPEQSIEIIYISTNISRLEQVNYLLDDVEKLPILRLYESVFPDNNLHQLKLITRNLAMKQKPIKMKWAEVEESEDAVLLWGELNDELLNFQFNLMNSINHLREGYYKQKYNSYKLDPSSQASLNKWGWVWGSDYSPYVVLSRPKLKFNLKDFEILWEYKYAILSKFVIALKTAPGTLTHREIITLK